MAVDRGLDLDEDALDGDCDFGRDAFGRRELEDLSFLRLAGLETLRLEALGWNAPSSPLSSSSSSSSSSAKTGSSGSDSGQETNLTSAAASP